MFSGDATLLKQMVGNLMENAIRHAQPAGLVTVAVSRDSTTISVRITDDGEGIAPENQAVCSSVLSASIAGHRAPDWASPSPDGSRRRTAARSCSNPPDRVEPASPSPCQLRDLCHQPFI